LSERKANAARRRVSELKAIKGNKPILEAIYYMTIRVICMENSAMVSPRETTLEKLKSIST